MKNNVYDKGIDVGTFECPTKLLLGQPPLKPTLEGRGKTQGNDILYAVHNDGRCLYITYGLPPKFQPRTFIVGIPELANALEGKYSERLLEETAQGILPPAMPKDFPARGLGHPVSPVRPIIRMPLNVTGPGNGMG